MQKWMEITDSIFQNKSKFKTFTDQDKIDNFYIINKKMSMGKLNVAQFFNNRFIGEANAIDLWFLLFRKTNRTPGWYWSKNPFTKDKKVKKIPKADIEMLMEYEQLTESEFDFLYEHYKDDVDYKIKLLKRLK